MEGNNEKNKVTRKEVPRKALKYQEENMERKNNRISKEFILERLGNRLVMFV